MTAELPWNAQFVRVVSSATLVPPGFQERHGPSLGSEKSAVAVLPVKDVSVTVAAIPDSASIAPPKPPVPMTEFWTKALFEMFKKPSVSPASKLIA